MIPTTTTPIIACLRSRADSSAEQQANSGNIQRPQISSISQHLRAQQVDRRGIVNQSHNSALYLPSRDQDDVNMASLALTTMGEGPLSTFKRLQSSSKPSAAAPIQRQGSFTWMQTSFLTNLRAMLRDMNMSQSSYIASWGPLGRDFQVKNPLLFARDILPRYFNIVSYTTFHRVLMTWGFQLRQDMEFDTFHHPKFVQDDSNRCVNASLQEMQRAAARGAHNNTLVSVSSFAQQTALVNPYIASRGHPPENSATTPVTPANVKPFQLTRSSKVAAKYSMAARLFKHKTRPGMMAAPTNRMKFSTGLGRGYDPSAKTRHKKKSSDFVDDLFHLLLDSSNDHVISWLPDGKAFKILKQVQFVQTILPAYTSLKPSYTSFWRMLDQHGFQQISTGPDKGAFSHPLFLRDHGHSLFKNKTAYQLKKASAAFIKVITPSKEDEEPQKVAKQAETPVSVADDDAPPEQVAV
jgi:hypothetical protein